MEKSSKDLSLELSAQNVPAFFFDFRSYWFSLGTFIETKSAQNFLEGEGNRFSKYVKSSIKRGNVREGISAMVNTVMPRV